MLYVGRGWVRSYRGPGGPQPTLCFPWNWFCTPAAENNKQTNKIMLKKGKLVKRLTRFSLGIIGFCKLLLYYAS